MPFMPDPTLSRLRSTLWACHDLEEAGLGWLGKLCFLSKRAVSFFFGYVQRLLSETRVSLFSLLGLSFYRSAFDLLTL
jgi:hypothetical protein